MDRAGGAPIPCRQRRGGLARSRPGSLARGGALPPLGRGRRASWPAVTPTPSRATAAAATPGVHGDHAVAALRQRPRAARSRPARQVFSPMDAAAAAAAAAAATRSETPTPTVLRVPRAVARRRPRSLGRRQGRETSRKSPNVSLSPAPAPLRQAAPLSLAATPGATVTVGSRATAADDRKRHHQRIVPSSPFHHPQAPQR